MLGLNFCGCLDITAHRLGELGINFVGDGHDAYQHQAEIDLAEVIVEGLKDADLEHTGLFDHHRRGVALSIPRYAMRDGGG